MNEPAFDPLSDIEPAKPEESLRKSVASFWIGCSGLAILSHVAIFLALRILASTQWLVETVVFENVNRNYWGNYWEILRGVAVVVNDSMMPCIVIATVVPILFWRGGLGQRFAISLALAITTMNYSLFNIWYLGLKSQDLQALLAILGCWAMFPILFLFTPLKTTQLRFIAATCLLILTVCVSGTMLEMMIACGLACAVATYLTKTELNRPIWLLGQTSLFAIVYVFVSLATIRSVLHWERKKIWLFMLCGLLVCLLMTWSSFSTQYVVGNRWGNIRQFFQSTAPVSIGLGVLFATTYWMVFLVTLGWWIKRCGWHIADKRT